MREEGEGERVREREGGERGVGKERERERERSEARNTQAHDHTVNEDGVSKRLFVAKKDPVNSRLHKGHNYIFAGSPTARDISVFQFDRVCSSFVTRL